MIVTHLRQRHLFFAVIVAVAVAMQPAGDEGVTNLSVPSPTLQTERRADVGAAVPEIQASNVLNTTNVNVTELVPVVVGQARSSDAKKMKKSRQVSPKSESATPMADAKKIQNSLDALSIELAGRLNEEHARSLHHRHELQAQRDAHLRRAKKFWGVAMRRLRHYMLYIMPLEQQKAIAARGAGLHYDVGADETSNFILQPLDDDQILHDYLSSVTCFKTSRSHHSSSPDSQSDGDDAVYNITMVFSGEDPTYPFSIRQFNKILPVSLSLRHQGSHDSHRSLGEGTSLDLNTDYLFASQSSGGHLIPVPGSFFSLFLSDVSLIRESDWVLFQTKLHAFVRDICVELMHNPLDLYDRGVLEEEEERLRAEEEEEQLRQLLIDL